MTDKPALETRLSSGLRAEMRHSSYGGWQLVVDGTPQSHVDVERPQYLAYEYSRRIGYVVDALPGGPLTALHLGAGAMSLARYINAKRPGSRQQVLELEPALVELVRGVAPLPKGASVRVRYGDARETLGRLPNGLRGTVDLVIVDIFAGSKTPGHVTSVEFYSLIRELLAPQGLVVTNIADGKGLVFARGQLATMQHVFGHAGAIADAGLLKGKRFGNIIGVAGTQFEVVDGLPPELGHELFPSKLVRGDELSRLIAGAPVITDANAIGSPDPDKRVFQVRS
ncbi:spermidine synthase [Agrococcus casei]|uniref:spermidine synthase n=1 Tax=Agrococcus casei TaxID=343512 RepID=UPI003F90592C